MELIQLKRMILFLFLMLLLPLTALADAKLIIATDLHYLAPELYDDGPYFTDMMARGDGKMTEYGDEILDALIDVTLAERPDALILTGDLTFNGEYASMARLAERLTVVQEAGVPVLVIPGNHDIRYPYAASYLGEHGAWVDNVPFETFMELCHPFGYDGAISHDATSFSYVWQLDNGVRLLFLDANATALAGEIERSTMDWAAAQLTEAESAGAPVISFMHQNLLVHHANFLTGTVVNHMTLVNELLTGHGVRDNFSGHLHVQHSKTRNGITDHAIGSIAVAPLRYMLVTVADNGDVVSEACALPVLQEEAAERFDRCTSKSIPRIVAELDAPEEDKAVMLDWGLRIHRAYFAGTVTPDFADEPGHALWQTYGSEASWFSYMEGILRMD